MENNGDKIYFDDVAEQESFEFGSYLLNKAEVIEFARQWDPQPFHVDEAAAKASVFGGLTASSLHLFAICTKLFALYRPSFAILAMLGKDQIKIPAPAGPGDTLTYRSTCISKKVSQSKPDRGVIVLSDELSKQDGTVVLMQTVTLMLARRT